MGTHAGTDNADIPVHTDSWKVIHGVYPPATRTIMNAVNKQSIARSETTGHVTSIATPRAPARLHAFEPGCDPNAEIKGIETR